MVRNKSISCINNFQHLLSKIHLHYFYTLVLHFLQDVENNNTTKNVPCSITFFCLLLYLYSRNKHSHTRMSDNNEVARKHGHYKRIRLHYISSYKNNDSQYIFINWLHLFVFDGGCVQFRSSSLSLPGKLANI